jgi:aminotransferase in exopolysaccharide biosynthesis|tara:strand:- start:1208 stop:2356 length:1149 start_codon:yes stop_codon:yes gene_type:complete
MNSFVDELSQFVRDIYQTDDFIALHAPRFLSNEKKYLVDAIDSSFVSTVGEYVNQFEQKVAEYIGAQYAIATVNGTAALHAALIVAGVKHNEEVITQSLTFVATCNAIRYCGADPVFVDVDRTSLGMSADSLAEFLNQHTEIRGNGQCWSKLTNRRIRACVPMHNFGHPVKINAIKKLCEENCIQLIEDAAESLGSYYDDQHTGTFGNISAISFNGNKIITTGGGGVVVTDDAEIARHLKHITTTAKQPHPWLYIHDELGFNYRMPNINAALGCAQMESLPDYIQNKRILAERYSSWFKETEYEFIQEPPNTRSNYWLNAFLTNNRDERDSILEQTNQNGIMTRPAWTPLHTLEMYRDCFRQDLPNTEWIEDRLVSIPSGVV